MKIKIRDYLPILHLEIEIPFLHVWTGIMYDRTDTMERRYVALGIKLWKWYFQFDLYDTDQRIHERSLRRKKGEA